MAVYRVDLLTQDPYPVFDWIDEHVPASRMVRRVAYETIKGWHMKVVFKRQEDAEAFHRCWFPAADDHSVQPWGFS